MMIKMTNCLFLTILLFLLYWSEPALGARNKLISGARTYDSALAPANETASFVQESGCKNMVEKFHYTCEDHTVTTKDGHILGMQRIPQGRSNVMSNSSEKPAAKPVVLLQHGLFVDAMSWMLLDNDSLPFFMAENGFDVWMNNNRGTKYSRSHKSLSVWSKKYWDWSWQELSEIDLDATVNYIHKKTGQKVHYIGHSMGTLVALAALASDQSTIKNMKSVALLSPIAYLDLTPSLFAKVGAHFFVAETRELLNLHEFSPMGAASRILSLQVCKQFDIDCSPTMWPVTGPNCCVDKHTMNRFLEHEPQSSSTKTLMHLAQNIRGGGIRKFDYGPEENKKKYGQETAPEYKMKNIPKDFPIFLGYGGTDTLADLLDVLRLVADLEDHNPKKLVSSLLLNYAHFDYAMARSARKDVYEPVLEFFKSHS